MFSLNEVIKSCFVFLVSFHMLFFTLLFQYLHYIFIISSFFYYYFFNYYLFFFSFLFLFKLNFHPRVVGTTSDLKIIVSNETAGRYYCKASVAGFPEIKAEAYVYMKQPPTILSPRQQYGARGDTLRLECSAFSVPKARLISWSYNGREINTAERDYSILEDPSARGIKSILVIRDSQDWHFGKYNCTVVNDYGVDVLQIELLHQSNYICFFFINRRF